jgi:hypothetical protein
VTYINALPVECDQNGAFELANAADVARPYPVPITFDSKRAKHAALTLTLRHGRANSGVIRLDDTTVGDSVRPRVLTTWMAGRGSCSR